jgi:dipeptidyl aminopeptidase/acylaminoacyl peptidase
VKHLRLVPHLLFISIFILIAGCNYPTSAVPSTEEIVTAVVGTLTAEASSLPPATVSPPILPHSLYFLSDRSGTSQVWRLNADGVTLTQMTQAAVTVNDFDVAQADGSLAYVSNNQLVLLTKDGQQILLVDNSAANSEAPDYYYNQLIKVPRFSPDGKTLAYALDGIFFYDLANAKTTQVLPNDLETQDDGSVSAKELYIPLEWSPDSTRLLIDIAYGEGSLLGVLHPGGDPLFIRLQSSGSFCCQIAWAPDSRSVLVASPYIELFESGLWRYDANTGGESALIDGYSDSVYNFVGWPIQLADGNLRYFYTSSTELPQGDQAFFMVSSKGDAVSVRRQLRPESFNVTDALWAEDGSFVLLVQPGQAGSGNSGAVVLVYSDGRNVLGLLDQAREPRWGP